MVCCLDKPESEYYVAKFSRRWKWSNNRALICKNCIEGFLKDYSNRYGEQMALALCCAMLDIPFYAETYRSVIENNSFFTIGLYTRQTNCLGQFNLKNFSNSIIEGEFGKSEAEVRESVEAKWSRQDKQNMNYSISVVGYDPFDECGMTNNDRRYCFNILAGYCDDESVRDDSHKIQTVIQLTHIHLQCKKIDESINRELANSAPEDKKIKEYATTKKNLLDSISKMVRDNNISSNYNEKSKKGKDTLSEKMKEMSANDYEAIKVNLFEIKKAEAMKQIADLSNRSILEQLSFDSNDYTDMIKEQREMILKYESDFDELREENRQLKNSLEALREKKR